MSDRTVHGIERDVAAATVEPGQRAEVEAFLHRAARLADESQYEAWLSLFDDTDVLYWVPSGRADYDPATRVSYVNDNRNRLVTRVRQLGTGVRYAQTPPSPMRRLLSNLELLDPADPTVPGAALVRHAPGTVPIVAGVNFVLYELSAQASNELRVWAGRSTYHLRRVDGGLRIGAKVVELVNASRPLPTMAFLL